MKKYQMSLRQKITIILIMTIATIFISIASQDLGTCSIEFLDFNTEISIRSVIFLTFIVGALFTIVLCKIKVTMIKTELKNVKTDLERCLKNKEKKDVFDLPGKIDDLTERIKTKSLKKGKIL